MAKRILNINKIDKLMESYTGLPGASTPWDYANLSPLEFCQYIIHAKERISFDKAKLLADLESDDPDNFASNKKFFDVIFTVK